MVSQRQQPSTTNPVDSILGFATIGVWLPILDSIALFSHFLRRVSLATVVVDKLEVMRTRMAALRSRVLLHPVEARHSQAAGLTPTVQWPLVLVAPRVEYLLAAQAVQALGARTTPGCTLLLMEVSCQSPRIS